MKRELEFYFKLLSWSWLIVPFHILMLTYAIIEGDRVGRGVVAWIATPYLLSILWMIFAFVFLLVNGDNKIKVSQKKSIFFSWQIAICYFCIILPILTYFLIQTN